MRKALITMNYLSRTHQRRQNSTMRNAVAPNVESPEQPGLGAARWTRDTPEIIKLMGRAIYPTSLGHRAR